MAYVGDIHHDEQINMGPNLVKLTIRRGIYRSEQAIDMVCIGEIPSALESCVNIS